MIVACAVVCLSLGVLGVGCDPPPPAAPPPAARAPLASQAPANQAPLRLVPAQESYTDPRDWRTDHNAALVDALRSGQPVLIDFTADWCAPCRRLVLETFSDDRVKQALSRFVTVKINATLPTPEIEALATRYGVERFPTIVFIDPRGVPMRKPRITRFITPEGMLGVLARVP